MGGATVGRGRLGVERIRPPQVAGLPAVFGGPAAGGCSVANQTFIAVEVDNRVLATALPRRPGDALSVGILDLALAVFRIVGTGLVVERRAGRFGRGRRVSG